MKQKRKRLWALLLSATLVVTQLPAVAMAENNPPEDGSITSFESLDSGVAKQTVPLGTELSELNLPDTVAAKVCHVTDDEIVDEDAPTASPSDAEGSVSAGSVTGGAIQSTTVTTSTENISVTWDSDPDYDGDAADSYVFTANVDGYALADGVKPPQITVTVKDDSQNGAEEPTPGDTTESQPEEPKPCEKTEGCTLPDGHEGDCVTEPPTNGMLRTIHDQHIQDGLLYKETGPDRVQLIGPADGKSGFAGTLKVPAEITVGEKTFVVTSIGNNAFSSTGITDLDLSEADNLTRIGDYAFMGCDDLKETVAVPASVAEIGILAFWSSGITGLDLSGADRLERIRGGAFSSCTALTGTVDVPASVTEIENRAFAYSGITGLDLSGADRLERIGESAFSSCAALTGTVVVPASVTEIGISAFHSSGITGLDLSGADRLERIGRSAFYSCAALTGTVVVPASVTEIGESAFYGGVITSFIAADNAVAGLLKDSGVEENLIKLPNGDTPQFPTQPAPGVTFTADSLNYAVAGNDTVTLTGYAGDAPAATLSVPATAENGGTTYRVTAIGNSAFYSSRITGLDLGGAANLERIGERAFQHCGDLTGTLVIPASVKVLGEFSFSWSGITGLDLSGANGLVRIDSDVFFSCKKLTGTVTIPASVTSIGSEAFWGNRITGLDLSGADSLTHIGTQAFVGNTLQTETVTIPPAVTEIGAMAFLNTGIVGAVIQGCLRTLGDEAFPANIPIHCADPATQLLVNEVLNLDERPTASWDGRDDIPGGAVVTVKDDVVVSGNVTIESGAELTVAPGGSLTIGAGASVTIEADAVITVESGGTMTIDPAATVNGGGTIVVEPGGTLIGTPGNGITVVRRQTYSVTVVNGAGGGDYAEGTTVNISAAVPSGKLFDRWTSASLGVNFGDAASADTSFTMPGNAVTVTANFKDTDKSTYTVTFNPAGGTRTGGGELTQTVSEGSAATAPTVTRSGYTFAGWDKDFSNVTAELTVTAQWSNNTPSGSGGGGSYTAPDPKNSYTVTGDQISQNVSRYDLQRLANTGKSLTLSCEKAGMVFEPAALKAILAAVPSTAGNITFAAAPADLSAFPDAAALLGSRPVYDFTITYTDSSGNAVPVTVNFPAGSAAVTLHYTPAAGEVTGSLFMVYVDGKGAVTWLDQSSYDSGKVLADAPHFSVYGVAYKTPAPVFTDTANHWAKADMEFVAARGLLTGTGNNQFSPDAAMTRGMFVTALGRLAGISPDSYTTRSFTDVKADTYYAAYVEWAAQEGIVKGTGEGVFSPDAPVTREQMAVMMVNYAGQMGYSIPAPLAEAAFADHASISTWAAKEVTAMQQAGIIKGKDGNRFDPQASATRAEVSAVLRRFVEIIIDPATAQGWTKNDSGHWLYYQSGKALTGWQTIGKLRYFFNADGVMHEGWKQDESTGEWYCWTDAGAVTGWREIGGKWYYFDENGVMAVNTTVDGYEVGPDGARKEV